MCGNMTDIQFPAAKIRRGKNCTINVVQFYTTLIRPMLEYASPLWHRSDQVSTEYLEAVQRIVLSISLFVIRHIPRLPLMLVRWQRLAFHPSKQDTDAWIIPNVYFKTFANPNLSITYSPTASRSSRDIPSP